MRVKSGPRVSRKSHGNSDGCVWLCSGSWSVLPWLSKSSLSLVYKGTQLPLSLTRHSPASCSMLWQYEPALAVDSQPLRTDSGFSASARAVFPGWKLLSTCLCFDNWTSSSSIQHTSHHLQEASFRFSGWVSFSCAASALITYSLSSFLPSLLAFSWLTFLF